MRKWSLVLAAVVPLFAASGTEDERIWHALGRLTYGARPGDVEAVQRMGLDKWIDAQLHPKGTLESQPRAKTGADQGKQAIRELTEAKLDRAIHSEWQLEEQLADFWFNHFNVSATKGAVRFMLVSYEREAIRPHVLGKFRDLLGAVAAHPAMLFYLDNWQNSSPDSQRFLKAKQAAGINENYARELLELHTLGVDNGYTQDDIVAVARCFTGWTILRPRQDGEFFFNARTHDQKEKIVLGVKIPAGGGQRDGEIVLDILARRPETARFISLKLARRFVADQPPSALIDHMAKTFRDTDGDIRAVLQTMIASPEFFSESARNAKVKTPLEFVVSAVRATGREPRSLAAVAQRLVELGQPLYRKVEPTGYPDLAEEWVNSSGLLARMNFAADLKSSLVGSPEFQRR